MCETESVHRNSPGFLPLREESAPENKQILSKYKHSSLDFWVGLPRARDT